MSTERSLFQTMGRLGYFSRIYEELPPDFIAIFEIARTLEDESSALHHALSKVVTLSAEEALHEVTVTEDDRSHSYEDLELQTDLIQSVHDLPHIYPSQFVLPEEIFLQRLVRHELWMPASKSQTILPIRGSQSETEFDTKKQKVYVLFDTSASMASHHRFHLAKAILDYFLYTNYRELGHVSFRTFDSVVGELHTAVDHESYEALLTHALRLTKLGDGTVLQRAILTAANDIREMEHLSGAEILIITDGAVQLSVEEIRASVDADTVIHTIKIGHAQLYATDARIHDLLTVGPYKDALLLDLEHRQRDTEHQLSHAQGVEMRRMLETSLSGIRRQIAERRTKLGAEIGQHFAHELEELSRIYVELDDIDETSVFGVSDADILELRELANSLLVEAEEFLTPDLWKKAALLHTQIQFLARSPANAEKKEALQTVDNQLRKLTDRLLNETQPGTPADGPQAAADSLTGPLNDEDLEDLKFLLQADFTLGGDWAKALRQLWLQIKRRLRRRSVRPRIG